MKTILLVAQASGSSNDTITRAAVECGRGLRHAGSIHEAFEILAEGGDEIDVVLLDADPGTHSLPTVDAIRLSVTAPPVIVFTGSPEPGIADMAYRHGATACISKRCTALELAALIKDVCLPESQRTGGSCDRWGHCERTGRRCIGHRYERLHCLSM